MIVPKAIPHVGRYPGRGPEVKPCSVWAFPFENQWENQAETDSVRSSCFIREAAGLWLTNLLISKGVMALVRGQVAPHWGAAGQQDSELEALMHGGRLETLRYNFLSSGGNW